MADESQNLEQNQHEKPMSFITMVVITGLFGGIFWSTLGYFAYVLNFTDIRPNIILEPWALGDWKNGWLGTVISIVAIGLFSVGAALLYYIMLRRINSLWAGVGYGIVLFFLVFFVLNPLFPGMEPFMKLSKHTLITSVCFYILYGVFVGYSISFEENEAKYRQKKNKEVPT
ncbi:YqhR family membrane protein [Mesobacillus harenae]|uniref:YqhR family membrane protein n=1 Tax=Mesobacillus harenae TaxID=2213203 RepID=UPI0015810879|nr:YqhR family membrane protein [Mesobacillus harenae]